MITCREFIEFLWKYRAGELPPEERLSFDAHLSVCPSCVNYLSNYEETIRLAGDAFSNPEAEVPEEVPDDLVKAVVCAVSKCRDR